MDATLKSYTCSLPRRSAEVEGRNAPCSKYGAIDCTNKVSRDWSESETRGWGVVYDPLRPQYLPKKHRFNLFFVFEGNASYPVFRFENATWYFETGAHL